jgi:hypothetical protein
MRLRLIFLLIKQSDEFHFVSLRDKLTLTDVLRTGSCIKGHCTQLRYKKS